jgi:riboflavin biosynthesis pyrimidine reductase
MRVVVVNHVSLDGVMQGPARPDEDTRDGFRLGGWVEHGADDPAVASALSRRMGPGFSWLFGRRSYDVPAAVADLRRAPGGNLVIMGSGRLIRSLLPHGLIDELFLMIHPVVLGSGRRLFGSTDDPTALTLVDHALSESGVILAAYRR